MQIRHMLAHLTSLNIEALMQNSLFRFLRTLDETVLYNYNWSDDVRESTFQAYRQPGFTMLRNDLLESLERSHTA